MPLSLSLALYHLPHQLFLSWELFTTASFSPLDYCSLPYFILYATSFLEHLSLTHCLSSLFLPSLVLPRGALYLLTSFSLQFSFLQEWSDKQLDATTSQATSLTIFQGSLEALKLEEDITSLITLLKPTPPARILQLTFNLDKPKTCSSWGSKC